MMNTAEQILDWLNLVSIYAKVKGDYERAANADLLYRTICESFNVEAA
jgi:hypothetical protein